MKYQSVSLTIGPPHRRVEVLNLGDPVGLSDVARLKIRRPRCRTAMGRRSHPRKIAPPTTLPPSFGMLLMRMPPAAISAGSALVVTRHFRRDRLVLVDLADAVFHGLDAHPVDHLHGFGPTDAVHPRRGLGQGAATRRRPESRRMPGTNMPTDMMLRVVGSASMTSRVSTCVRCACWTSTSGVAPDTVIGLLERADFHVGVDRGGEVATAVRCRRARPSRTRSA